MMLYDSVLFSSLIFFVSTGILWFLHNKVQNSNLEPRVKRIIAYLLMAMLFIIVVIIFNYHSSNFIISNA